MAIHFTCSQCNKPLFAQEQYAGRVVVCPACQARNTIPQPQPPQPPQPLLGLEGETTFVPGRVQTPSAVSPLVEGDPQLLDMEKPPVEELVMVGAPPASTPPAAEFSAAPSVTPLPASPMMPDNSAPVSTTPAPPASLPPAESPLPPAPIAAPPVQPAISPEDATRRCPVCAETIKVLAKKCRYCGAVFDESLREVDEHDRKTNVSQSVIAEVQRTANTWRALAVIVTGLTIGWMSFITINIWSFAEPNLLMIFNPLLIIGLIWNSRQMKSGPAQVFFSAALAIMLCMPLNVMLGLPFPGPEMQKEIIQQNQAKLKELSPEEIATTMKISGFLFFLAVGFVFSIPAWVAMMQVSGLQRLQAKLGKTK